MGKRKKEMAVGDLFFQHQFVVTYSQWMALDIMCLGFTVCKTGKNVSHVLLGSWEELNDRKAAALRHVGSSIRHSGILLATDGKRLESEVS